MDNDCVPFGDDLIDMLAGATLRTYRKILNPIAEGDTFIVHCQLSIVNLLSSHCMASTE